MAINYILLQHALCTIYHLYFLRKEYSCDLLAFSNRIDNEQPPRWPGVAIETPSFIVLTYNERGGRPRNVTPNPLY